MSAQESKAGAPWAAQAGARTFKPSVVQFVQPATGGKTQADLNLTEPGSTRLTRPASSSSMTVEAAPFVPGKGNGPRLNGAAANAPVFVPGGAMGSSMRSLNPTGVASTRGGGSGMVAPATMRLPEGDDLLGMTSYGPGDGHTRYGQHQPPRQQAYGQSDGSRPTSAEPHFTAAASGGSGFGSGTQGRGLRGRGGGGPSGGGAGRGMQPVAANDYDRSGGYERGGRGSRGRGRRGGFSGGGSGAGVYSAGPGKALMAQNFMSERLRGELQQRAYMVAAQLNPDTDAELGLPDMVGQYHSIYPLEDVAEEGVSVAFGVCTLLVKGILTADGLPYALRRVDPRQLPPSAEQYTAVREAVEAWQPLSSHPNIAALRSAFVSSEISGTAALYLVHDYHPGALTLEQAHIQPTATASGLVRNAPTEDQLWAYLVQLTSALRAIHSAGLACRAASLVPSKVLLVSTNRVRIGSLGMIDALAGPLSSQEELLLHQREDLAGVGRLMLALACSGLGVPPSLDHCMAHFSMDFARIVGALLASPDGGGLATWRSLAAALGERVFMELDSQQLSTDAVTAELAKELQNGRLLRLLVKLSTVTERPEHDSQPQWSETGDRYLLKLFRDFVFHQISEEGAPLVDWGLVLESLAKLDAGVPEKILLLSRDEMSMLVVSYGDIKRCLEAAHQDLQWRGTAARAASRARPASAAET